MSVVDEETTKHTACCDSPQTVTGDIREPSIQTCCLCVQTQSLHCTDGRRVVPGSQGKVQDSSLSRVTQKLSDWNLRNWLEKHGKHEYIDFNNKERRQYKEIFDALDNDGSKSISAKELEDPLIALGFVASHDKVKELIAEVDEDGSEKIEFDEFLLIMMSIKKKSKEDTSKGSSSLYEFFKGMIDGNLDKMGDMDNSLPFMLNYSLYRRRRILDAIMGETDEKKKEGQKIMKVVLSDIELRCSTDAKQTRRTGRQGRRSWHSSYRRNLCK